MKIDDPSLKDLENADHDKFEKLLISKVIDTFEKVWNDGHRSSDFSPDQNGEKVAPNVCPVNKLSDIFFIETTTSYEVNKALKKDKA